VSVKEHLPPLTVYVYVPPASVASRTTALGPLLLEPFDSPRARALHFENVSFASAKPEPTTTLNARDGFCGFSDPENVVTWVLGDGAGAAPGAAATTAVGVDDAVAAPALFVAVTVTRRVKPTSDDCAV
jgi:hypothetical protein